MVPHSRISARFGSCCAYLLEFVVNGVTFHISTIRNLPGFLTSQDLDKFADRFLLPDIPAGSNGRCNTIWYKAAFKGGVHEARETVWAFRGTEDRRVASLEGGADVA